ncbi:MAG: hypothetical protein JNJ45_05585 [Chthonomonas sp.]|nr:hypothetical protein [Chthonomonas sp.]
MGNLSITVQEALEIIDGGSSFMHEGRIISTRDQLRSALGERLPDDPEPVELADDDGQKIDDDLEERLLDLELAVDEWQGEKAALLARVEQLELHVNELLGGDNGSVQAVVEASATDPKPEEKPKAEPAKDKPKEK